MTLFPLGDSAVVLTLGDAVDEAMVARVQALATSIGHERLRGVIEILPAFASVAVFYDPAHFGGYEKLAAELRAIMARSDQAVVSREPRRVEIPVCYGGEFGPDLEVVASHHAISVADAIALHTGASYLVHAIGFVPGFAYLGGLPRRLATPRRSTPRREVPAGTVAIGGVQTGVYPLVTPGGWNLVGRTPLRMFDPARTEPSLLHTGDYVHFRAITAVEFAAASSNAIRYFEPGTGRGAESGVAQRGSPAGIEVVRPGMFTTVQDSGEADTGPRALY